MRLPDLEYARTVIGHDSETGRLTRLRPVRGSKKGKHPETLHPEGYYVVSVDYRTIKAHILVWALVYGEWPSDDEVIIHKDGDRLNNRLDNLELVRKCPSYNVADLFVYDPETGKFSWRYKAAKNGSPLRGDPGWTNCGGYQMLNVSRKNMMAHRAAHIIMTGSDVPKGHEIDHINGVRDDNRWRNLRVVRRSQNNMNSKIRSDNKSGVKGVCYDKTRGQWAAEIKADGKRWRLGRFDTIEEAAKVRAEAEERIFGEYRRKPKESKICQP